MADEKDRLGDTLHKKERGEEERYFAEQDRLRLAKLRARQSGVCPHCGRRRVDPTGGEAPADACDGGCGTP
jgi:hypothetical protein